MANDDLLSELVVRLGRNRSFNIPDTVGTHFAGGRKMYGYKFGLRCELVELMRKRRGRESRTQIGENILVDVTLGVDEYTGHIPEGTYILHCMGDYDLARLKIEGRVGEE